MGTYMYNYMRVYIRPWRPVIVNALSDTTYMNIGTYIYNYMRLYICMHL